MKENFDRDQWRKLLKSVINAPTRINRRLMDCHPDDFAPLPFLGVQTAVLYWDSGLLKQQNPARIQLRQFLLEEQLCPLIVPLQVVPQVVR